MPRAVSERAMVFLVGAVQLVNVLDFMMVMPLGPDFARDLGIPTSSLGFIGGSYTAAAALGGLAGAKVLDRFDRRSALAVAMLGLVAGTASGAAAQGLASLIAARVLAGLFGGPAASLSLAIIADVVPPERRGKAMGAVMGSFSVASVLGVPAGLWMAQYGGWRVPFLVVAALGLLIAASSIALMPAMRGHIKQGASPRGILAVLASPTSALALGASALATVGGFLLVPNLSAYYQMNMGFPRERLGQLYMAGGAVSFVALRLIGPLVDKLGAAAVAAAGTLLYLVVLYVGFVAPVAGLPVMLLFVTFMLCMSVRNVPLSSIASRVPAPSERAGFMSLQSVAQHLFAAVGAFTAAKILAEGPGGRLEHVPEVAGLSMLVSALVPLLLWAVETRVRQRESAPSLSPAPSVSPAPAEAAVSPAPAGE